MPGGPTTLRLMFAILLALGGALAALGLQLYADDHAAADWLPIEATIVDLEVRSPIPSTRSTAETGSAPAGPAPRHVPVVVYEWQVGDIAYRSTRYRLAGALADPGSRKAAWQALSGYRIGDRLTAYRHPEQPERAVLEREGSARGAWLVACGVLLMVLGGVGIGAAVRIYDALRVPRAARQA